ncbi:MAG: signal peptidase I, partial [Clostridiales bacterium]|nr:signal peptidase I [Clostridiales bacterium]
EGKVFAMGDNRLNSLDSRSPQVGLIEIDEIMGKAVLRVFPFSQFGLLDTIEE